MLEILPGVIVEGALLGSVYAMVALGYTMVYGVLGLINFAHSEIFMIGAITGAEVFRHLAPVGFNPFLILAAALAAGAASAGCAAVAVERFAYRPLRRHGSGNRLVPLITAIGVSFLLQDLVRLVEGIWHNEFYISYPSTAAFERDLFSWAGVNLQIKSAIVITVAVGMMAGLTLLVERTRLGRAIRAVAQDSQAASLMGVDPDAIISRTFLVGGSLGGAAGVLFGIMFAQVNPFVGFMPGIKAFTAAVLGGIGSIPGAMAGGMVLGIVETAGAAYLPLATGGAVGSEYTDLLAFVVLVLLLLFRPQGLFGKPEIDKV